MCGNKNHIYICDNFNLKFFFYNYNTDHWSPIPANPYNRLSNPLCMTCDDSRLFVIGSYKSRGKWENKGRTLSAYDPRAGEWQKLEDSWLYHTARDECCFHKGRLYASCLKEEHTNYASYGETCVKGMDAYDVIAGKWDSVLHTPENEIYSHRLISYDNLLWMVSDGFGEYGQDESISVHTYNSFTKMWERSELLDSAIVNKTYPNNIRNDHVSIRRNLIDVVSLQN